MSSKQTGWRLGGRTFAASLPDSPGSREHRQARAVDVALAIPLLVFLAPAFIAIYALLKIADPGSAIFAQRRFGRHGRTFLVYKFRTMRLDAGSRLAARLRASPTAGIEWAKFQKLGSDRA